MTGSSTEMRRKIFLDDKLSIIAYSELVSQDSSTKAVGIVTEKSDLFLRKGDVRFTFYDEGAGMSLESSKLRILMSLETSCCS
jgi:hypothetical protein